MSYVTFSLPRIGKGLTNPMKNPSVLLRAAIALVAVLVIALAGGQWVASAQGTIPVPPGGPVEVPGWDEIVAGVPDWVAESLEIWFAFFGDQNPCGFFQTEWGQVRVPLGNLEACQAAQGNLTVMCLTSNGTLTRESVKNVGVTSDGSRLLLETYTEQGGHCGIFVGDGMPAPGVIGGGVGDLLKAWDMTDPYTASGDARITNELPNWFSAFSQYNPCGFFPVHWGSMAVSLETTESCLEHVGNLTVMCITGDAGLTQATVKPGSVGVSPDGATLYTVYDAQQDGHCGVFEGPAPSGVATGVIRP